ncbi:MAG: glycosyltransferase, partial [Candidatus Hydrogenedentota bacterium]
MIHLVLFFTRGVSLQSWKDAGILERELALYRRLMGRGVRVSLVTYGDGSERKFAERIPGISILCNDRRLPQAVYAFFLPLLHGAALNGATVFKTNQLDGADVAIRAAVYWRKPLIARCGYMRSFILEKELGASSPTARLMRRQEDRAFETARKIVVTTAALRDDVVTRVPTAEEKTVVIPNYVDTSLFQPVDRDETSG